MIERSIRCRIFTTSGSASEHVMSYTHYKAKNLLKLGIQSRCAIGSTEWRYYEWFDVNALTPSWFISPTITEIPNAAFRFRATLIEVTMAILSDDDRARSIIWQIGQQHCAFQGCKKLPRIIGLIPIGLTRIGFGAFKEYAIEGELIILFQVLW